MCTRDHGSWGLPLLAMMALLLPAAPALAYVGPGLGAGAVAVVLGIVGSILLALVAIVWYPLKRLLKKRHKPAAASADGCDQDPPAA